MAEKQNPYRILADYVDAHLETQKAEDAAREARHRRSLAADRLYERLAQPAGGEYYVIDALGEFVTLVHAGRYFLIHLDVDGDGAHTVREIPAPVCGEDNPGPGEVPAS